MAQHSLDNSLFHVVLRDATNLIGMGRVDGVMYFYVQDVVVDPDYQSQGLGTRLMHHIEQYLSTVAKPGATIALLAAKGKEGFYTRLGYQLRAGDVLGHGMCKFVSAEIV